MTEVLAAPGNGGSHFESGPLHRSSSHSLLTLNTSDPYLQSSNSSYRHAEYETGPSASAPSSAPSSPQFEHHAFSRSSSYTSTPASSLSLDTKADLEEAAEEEDTPFPSFEGAKQKEQIAERAEDPESYFIGNDSPARPEELRRISSSELPQTLYDDQAIEDQPTRHVDYLSHEWKAEEDIWSSWRYIVARRNVYSNGMRLENASWRTWAKTKYHLKTVSPEALNWLKDCDVTWLYGPLHSDSRKSLNLSNSPPPSRLSTSSSFIDKKPILKKKSASQTILQRSISSHSLLKQAGAMLQAQQSGPTKGRPSYQRSSSEFCVTTSSRTSSTNTPAAEDSSFSQSTRHSVTSSGLQSPSERRHIHFNNEVEQCIAVDSKDDDEADEEERHSAVNEDEDDDDDEGIMMKQMPSKAKISNRSTPRNSFSNESKTIKPLPSTTLKYRGDTPEPNEAQQLLGMNRFWPTAKILSPSPSQETLRPSRPQANFLLDDDDEDIEIQWQPSNYSHSSSPEREGSPSHHPDQQSEDEYDPGPGMRRTPSGMFMPYEEDEEEAAMNNSLFGRVVDTVNTARDIAHVIWNVGWRR